MKVLLLCRYGFLGASSRVRFLQYLPYFGAEGLEVSVQHLLSDIYLRALYNGGSPWWEVLKGYARRMLALMGARQFDLVIIEKELFPFMPAIGERFLRLIGVPYLVDYDDASFHRYDCHSNVAVRRLLGRKIDAVMRHSVMVTAGNNYLAERAREAGARSVEIVPSVVDADRYGLKQSEEETGKVPIVGWMGTPPTSRYLAELLPVFEAIRDEMPVRFVAVGARAEDFAGTPVEVWPWVEATEVAAIQQFDVGIMPLLDSPWERGKCGYKLIQYMACGVPVVASPVGVNCEIVVSGENGLLAGNMEEWGRALRELLTAAPSIRKEMGAVGRAKVEAWYSLQAQGPRFLSLIREASGGA